MTTRYFTSEKKAEIKTKLRMAFKSRLVGELVDQMEAALDDFYTDELIDQITAQIVDGELIDAAIDTLVAAGKSFSATPDAAANDACMANVALSAETQEITEGLTDPDVPRPVLLVTTMAGGTLTGNVGLTGTNVNDEVISETLALNGAADITSIKCYKTITQVDLPVQVTAGDGIAIGTVAKIGSPILLTKDTIYMALVDGSQDTLPTVTVDAADVEKVIIEPNTAPDGSKVFDFFYHA